MNIHALICILDMAFLALRPFSDLCITHVVVYSVFVVALASLYLLISISMVHLSKFQFSGRTSKNVVEVWILFSIVPLIDWLENVIRGHLLSLLWLGVLFFYCCWVLFWSIIFVLRYQLWMWQILCVITIIEIALAAEKISYQNITFFLSFVAATSHFGSTELFTSTLFSNHITP